MSRTYYHNLTNLPGCAKDKSAKKRFNRRIRRKYKHELDFPDNAAYKRMNEPWDICDYRCDCSYDSFKRWLYTSLFDNEPDRRKYWEAHYRSR